ncbi:hypothetical protein Aperf_G00000072124 [Anoplocephala perfoliata]
MVCRRVRVVEYQKLLEPDEFFQYGRPQVEPPRFSVIFRLPLDALLIVLLSLTLIGVVAHFIAAFLYLPAFPPLPAKASTDCAYLQGAWNADNTVLHFFSVPYAVPPLAKPDEETMDVLREYLNVVGGKPSLRWNLPQALNSIEGCVLAHHDRCSFKRGRWTCDLRKPRPVAFCIQPTIDEKVELRDTERLFQSERCLQVDIATPIYEGVLRPVVVVIAGFQFLTEPMISPESQKAAFWPTDETIYHSDAVWVYLHYRLGIAGFFYNLTKPRSESKTDRKLSHENLALHDQLVGLRWIKVHIKQFGGDPDRITLLGISSGATSVLALMQMKNKNEKLFSQAWLSSGAVHWYSERDGTFRKSAVDTAFSDIASHHIGTHCIPLKPGIELEGWPGMGETWMNEADDEQLDRIAKMFYRFRIPTESQSLQSLKNLLGAAWKADLTFRSKAALSARFRQEFHLELLSILRFSCPQAWIISKLMGSQSIFYKILLDEPSGRGVPHAPGPGFMSNKIDTLPRRGAFHSLDMVILTGKFAKSQEAAQLKRSLRTFSDEFRKMFKAFIHGGDLDPKCKANPNDPHGCRINGVRTEKFADSKIITKLCAGIDWEKWISDIIVHN